MPEHLAGFLEQGDRPRPRVGNLGEGGGRAQFAAGRCRRLGDARGSASERHGEHRKDERDPCCRAHRNHAFPWTIGSRRGRGTPRRAIALATAGATGGRPGSPTPVGGSDDGTITTSTSGISWIRSER
jgi:hypothetical protein